MKRFFRTIIILVLLALAAGYYFSSRGYNLPLFSKPENAVHDIMKQETLMEILAYIEDGVKAQDKDDEDYSLFVNELFTSSATKSFFLDNVRSIEYKITNVSTNGNTDKATVTALITHLDITPVVDRSIELFVDKLKEMDPSGMDIPEDEEGITQLLWPVMQKSIKEAAAKTKPTETYSTVKFKCVKNEILIWELEDLPDDFGEVLVMNIDMALDNAGTLLESLLS